jgi:hypothetical protein
MRTVARIELPSTRQPTIWARFSVLKRFILAIMPEPGQFVNSEWPLFAPLRHAIIRYMEFVA